MYDMFTGIVFNEVTIINLIFILWALRGKRPNHASRSVFYYMLLMLPAAVAANLRTEEWTNTLFTIYGSLLVVSYSVFYYKQKVWRAVSTAVAVMTFYVLAEYILSLPAAFYGIHPGENYLIDLYMFLALTTVGFMAYRARIKIAYRVISSKNSSIVCSGLVFIIAIFYILVLNKTTEKIDMSLLIVLLLIMAATAASITLQIPSYKKLEDEEAHKIAITSITEGLLRNSNNFHLFNSHSDKTIGGLIMDSILLAPSSLTITSDVTDSSAKISCNYMDFYRITQILFCTVFDNYCNDRMHVILGKKVLGGVDRFSLCAKVSHDKLDEAQVFEKPKDKKLRKSSMYYARKIAKSYDGDLRLENGDNGTVSFTLII